jgi:hypothetical protein
VDFEQGIDSPVALRRPLETGLQACKLRESRRRPLRSKP